jgi:formate dehydrogenase (NADP+) beta subunit
MEPTNTRDPRYYHKVVDCQWACPAHTNVPEYIRLIAQGRYTDAYMLNRASNVFPGILGRVCDRPCEPACRRKRVDGKPVAICRLKRVAADLRESVAHRIPKGPFPRNGKRVALIGGGPSSLTVANDLLPLGYEVVCYEKQDRLGGLMVGNIPAFRLPARVLDDEIGFIVDMGLGVRLNTTVMSLKALLDEGYDAVFVGVGAPRGKDLYLPGRWDTERVHVGIEWLESLAFRRVESVGERVLVIGVGNTAMDCCRAAKRLGGKDVKVVARRGRKDFKASEWELEDAEAEDVEVVEYHVPKAYVVEGEVLKGMTFDRVEWFTGEDGKEQVHAIEEVFVPCDDVILAIGQENVFPWIERDIGIEFGKWNMPVVDRGTLQSTRAGVFFGGDAAWGPENIIWAVEHGHQAAISIHNHCQGIALTERPPFGMNLVSQKMGLHEWSYSNDYNPAGRTAMRYADLEDRLRGIAVEAELGFSAEETAREVERCLNCDIQTDFTANLCIECDACIDICPLNCLTMTENGLDAELRTRLSAPSENLDQALFVSEDLPQTRRVMVKDEDLCVHCGLCAERCPTAAWDMRKSELLVPQAGWVSWPS